MTAKKAPANDFVADAQAALTETPGVTEDAEVLDAPLALPATGPRDALVTPEAQDYVPDIEEKGYHVGLVRQPADLVGNPATGAEGFRSQGGDSKFAYGSLAHLKAAHNAAEKGGIEGSVPPSPPVTADEAEASRTHANDAS